MSKFPKFMLLDVEESDSYLLDALYEDKNKRLLANTFNKVRELLMQDKTEEALRIYKNASEDVVKAVRLESVDIFEDTSRYDTFLAKRDNFSNYYVTTGFKELDDVIGGWDRKEELATIVARTNQGKSWILLKCALAAAQAGLRVGIYSGEMSDTKVGYRIDTLLGHIANTAITHGDDSITVAYKKYIDSMKSNVKGTIKVITPAMINGTVGVTALRAFIEKENLDMLCVDQHSLLEDDRGARNPVERASNISKDLKILQVTKQIPIISVSQQNRESTENGVDTTHIAQSDRIAQDSTVILFFENKDHIMTLNLVKSRDSSNGKKLRYAIDLNKGIFEYQPEEDDAKGGVDCARLKAEFDDDNYIRGDDNFDASYI